jgi:hypothetical protein
VNASKELRPAYVAVLNGLEVANTALGRACTIVEIIEALSSSERSLLESTYKNPLPTAISSVLFQLCAPVRNLAYLSGHVGHHRFFASPRIIDRKEVKLPDVSTKAHLVLKLVRRAVIEMERAVQIKEVIAYAEGKQEYEKLRPETIENAILRLHRDGDLIVVKVVRGCRRYLYLPAEMKESIFASPPPISWLDEVKEAFDELWEARLEEAEREQRFPRPLTTREVRAHLKQRGSYEKFQVPADEGVNSLLALSKHGNSPLRRISRQRRKSLLWAPADTSDETLDLGNTYSSDTERVSVAVRRAATRHNRPVRLNEVIHEMEADPALRPVRVKSLTKAIVGSVDYLDEEGNTRRNRHRHNKNYVHVVGLLSARAFYFPCGEGTAQARAYVEFRQLEQEWQELRADEQLYDIEGCRLPSVAVGRVRLLALDAERIASRLRSMICDGLLVDQWAEEAEALCSLIDDAREWAGAWPSAFATKAHKLPERASDLIPTVSKEELRALFEPIYPNIRRAEKACQVTTMLATRIRRVRIPGLLRRKYDRTDAFLFAARRWGGRECCLQAGIAAAELGYLRDPRFIFPAIYAADVDARLTAIACLAYVQSEEGNKLLKQLAMKDTEHGLRQSALWAYRFAGGQWAEDLATVMSKHDPVEEVREFATRVLEAQGAAIWQL